MTHIPNLHQSPANPRLQTDSNHHTANTGQRFRLFAIMSLSVIATLAVLCYLGFVLYQFTKFEPKAVFPGGKIVKIKPKTPEHDINVAKHAAMATQPTFEKKLVSTKPTAFSLPVIEENQISEIPKADYSPQSTSISGRNRSGGISGAGSGFDGDGTSLFSLPADKARSVVIMIDVSGSMFGRTGDLDYSTGKLVRRGKEQSFQTIRDEAIKLINGLSINSRFGLIKWSGGAYSWQPNLVNATAQNKADAIAYIQEKIDAKSAPPKNGMPGGTRHDYALQELFKLNPEVAYMLSDGNATRSQAGGGMTVIDPSELTDIVRAAKDKKAITQEQFTRIHTIYYLTGSDNPEEAKMLRKIARLSGGKFLKVKAKKIAD